MTSSYRNVFRIKDPWWGEFTGDRWTLCTKGHDADLWCFICSSPEQTVEKFEVPVIWGDMTLVCCHCKIAWIPPLWHMAVESHARQHPPAVHIWVVIEWPLHACINHSPWNSEGVTIENPQPSLQDVYNCINICRTTFIKVVNLHGILYSLLVHDDVIKWKHFPRYWPFVRGIHRSPVNSPHKGQRRGALMFILICARINGWVNTREAGDLRWHRAHYDVTVMCPSNDVMGIIWSDVGPCAHLEGQGVSRKKKTQVKLNGNKGCTIGLASNINRS